VFLLVKKHRKMCKTALNNPEKCVILMVLQRKDSGLFEAQCNSSFDRLEIQ